MLADIEQQIFELSLTGINPHDREIKIHGRHMNRVNKHVKENRERVRHERRGYHRKVIDNTKINLRKNVTNPVDPLIYDATAVWSAIARASHKVSKTIAPFFRIHNFAYCLFTNTIISIVITIMTVAVIDICVIFKKICNMFVLWINSSYKCNFFRQYARFLLIKNDITSFSKFFKILYFFIIS